MKNKKIILFISIFMLFISFIFSTVMADKDLDISKIQSLLDSVTYSCLLNTENPENRSQFYADFFSFLNKFYDGTSHDNLFVDEIPKDIKPSEKSIDKYIGFNLLFEKKIEDAWVLYGNIYEADSVLEKLNSSNADSLKWLDNRIAITIVPSKDNQFGYKIAEYNLNADLLFEEELDVYFNAKMKEYINSDLNITFQYPYIFSEDNISEKKDEVSIYDNEKGQAILLKCFSNPNKLTAELYYKQLQDSKDFKNIALDLSNKKVFLTKVNDQGRVSLNVYAFTEDIIYHGEYTMAIDQLREYGVLATYFMNTFENSYNNIG